MSQVRYWRRNVYVIVKVKCKKPALKSSEVKLDSICSTHLFFLILERNSSHHSSWLKLRMLYGQLYSVYISSKETDSCFLSFGGFLSWQTGEWNACSVTCGGGSQVRTVQCVSNDVSGPRVVEDAICAAYADAPPPLQTCNMQKCAEYHVTGWSAVSKL